MIAKKQISTCLVFAFAAAFLSYDNETVEMPVSFDGDWVLCDAANELLGYTLENPRKGSAFSQYPASFRLTSHKATNKEINDSIQELVGENIFKTDDIKLMNWESDFHIAEEWDTTSFLVHRAGTTGLYSPVPYAVIYGGPVSLINGSKKSKDLLVINFNHHGDERTPDTVVYRRKPMQ